ncbi:MAG: DUF58 domain-containing protein [Myxococcaceae bacterium]|nr:DUF58 domain-containing protein [Myxococcaceae bacterium]
MRALLRPPRSLRITPAGRTFLIVTLGVGLGALNTGNNLLYLVLGLQLSLIVISGVLSERCLRGLTVRRLGADGAFAGEPFAFRWAVRRARGHSFALELQEENPDLQGSGLLAHLGPGEQAIVRGDLVAQRRGPHRLAAVKVTTQFPFGLFAKTRTFPLEGLVEVFPRRVPPPHHEPSGKDGDDGQQPRSQSAGGTGEVVELAPYREGDDARRIHWVRSAALGQLVRVDRAREERRTFLLRTTVGTPGERRERECEALAATARRLLAQGHKVGLRTDSVELRPSSGPGQERRLLIALSHVGFAMPERERR